MNFARKIYNYQYNHHYNAAKKEKDSKSKEENQNSYNQAILDSIIDDDDNKLSELVAQAGNVSDMNQTFVMTNYKFPRIMSNKPSYASLCAYFCAEKCLELLSMLEPEGLESEQIKKTDDFGRSIIHFACAGGSLKIIRELDQSGYSFDIKDKEGCLPSHYAAMAGHIDVIKYLWAKGADLLSGSNNFGSMTPLHVACLYGNLDVVKFICETVVGDDDGLNDNNENDNSEKCASLKKILNFTSFYHRYCKNSTPLHLACEGGHADILNYLLSKKDLVATQINSLDYSSCTPLLVACQNGSLECIKSLISTGDVQLDMKKRRHLPLIDAAAAGHIDIVKYLINTKGINIYRENSQKIDALRAAVINDNFDIVKCLIDNKALSNYDDAKIGDLFISALKTNNYDMMVYLDSVCNVPYDKKSNNKVHYWSCSHSLHLDENSTWGTQFMQQACLLENEKMVEFLLKKGVTLDNVDLAINTKKSWGPFMDFLFENGIDLKGSHGTPSLIAAIKQGNIKNVKKLISKGAKLDRDIIMQNDCILDVCTNGKADLFDFLMSFKPDITNGEKCINECLFSYHYRNMKQRIIIAEKILKEGCVDLNKRINDYNDETLVSRAVFHKSIPYLDLFGKYGADFENVPLRYSQMSLKSFNPIFNYLAEHGCKFNKAINYGYNHFNMNTNNYIYQCCTPLQQSFSQMRHFQFDVNIPLLLIDYIDKDEIDRIICGYENIVDNFLSLNCYEGLLKLFKKCNCVVYPRYGKNDFIDAIESSGNQDLIDYVRKFANK